MPKIHEEQITIKLFKLIKKEQEISAIVNKELIDALTSVVEELAGDGIVVEIEAKS